MTVNSDTLSELSLPPRLLVASSSTVPVYFGVNVNLVSDTTSAAIVTQSTSSATLISNIFVIKIRLILR